MRGSVYYQSAELTKVIFFEGAKKHNRIDPNHIHYNGYLGTFGKNATKNFKLTLKSDTLLYEPLELIFPYKYTLSTPKTISSSIS